MPPTLISSIHARVSMFRAAAIAHSLLVLLLPGGHALGQNKPQAELSQARNGTPSVSVDPVGWVRGNVGPANSHYVEGFSVPYRAVISGLATGLTHTLIIQWDTKQSGGHAIDYLTHYQRLRPHDQFGAHTTAETVLPLDGLAGVFQAPRTSPIPSPSGAGSPVPGLPASSLNALPESERVFTIWNGTITKAVYVAEDDLGLVSASSTLAISFTAEDPTVVVSWGGHIATKSDWGAGNSATSIGGSPYHMRMISIDGGGGNQDRSLQALAVVSPPIVNVSGPATVCPLVTNVVNVGSDAGSNGTFLWSLTNDTAGAMLVGPTTNATVQVVATQPGSFTVLALVSNGSGHSSDSLTVTVLVPTGTTPLADQTACVGSSVTFATTATGTGPLSYAWTKDGIPLDGANGPSLVITGLSAAAAGRYCVEVQGACGSDSRCATLTVQPLPAISCPAEVVAVCLRDLPEPDPASVLISSGPPPVLVTHAGDVLSTNAGDFIITRTYQAVDACGQLAFCSQRLIARDRTPPQLTCPADLVVAEDPPGSGQAVVNFTPPIASDNCDPSPAVVCTPSTGSSLAVGDTLVQCLATDAAGNTSTCSFRVRVVPRRISVSSLADSGPGTLRQALLDANATPGSNTIAFSFAGSPPYTVQLLTPLPPVTEPIFIDGWSQLTFAGTPVVELDGASANPALAPASLGADATYGLVLSSAGNVIRGVALYGFTVGLRIEGPGGNVIAGNFVGSDHSGTNALGNLRDGILLTGGTSNNVIGPDNLIVYNGRNGVTLDASAGTGNSILGNRIVFNGGLAIDLGDDGATANHPGGVEEGPNHLQNAPVLVNTQSDGRSSTTVQGVLDAQPNTDFTIEFILDRSDAGSEPGQVETVLGQISLRTDSAGQASFSATFSLGLLPGQIITATATDSAQNTSERALPAIVRTPPILLTQPEGADLPLGGSALLCVTAIGTEPLSYQWRHNGANIPDATNACYAITGADISDGGSYNVVVANEIDAIPSDSAVITLDLPQVAIGDNFVDRVPLPGLAGAVTGTNNAATIEPGEPLHAGKPGGRSVWYAWMAPTNGVATFRTTGSSFDTLLGIYLGNTVTNLTPVASDEDRGGYYTSQASFNVTAGAEYKIAIDGYGGIGGNFILGWTFAATNQLLPLITNQPVSQTVLPGGTATFQVGAAGVCGPGMDCEEPDEDGRHHGKDDDDDDVVPVFFQWYLNGVPIPDATNATLLIANAVEANLGNYTVQVRQGTAIVESLPASLQLNLTGPGFEPIQAADKFLDAANAPVQLRLGTPGTFAPAGFEAASLARGYTGTQVFNTSGSLSQGEIICHVTGGSSEWISFVAEENGTLFLNTDGSSFDTVMAVFNRSPTNATKLDQLACDNDSGLDHHDSSLQVPVLAGRTNFIVIDGVNGATGTLRLNYSLVTPASLTALGLSTQRAGLVRVVGHASMRFSIQTSTNLLQWTTLVTTNSAAAVFDYTDTTATNAPLRYYRAVMLP